MVAVADGGADGAVEQACGGGVVESLGDAAAAVGAEGWAAGAVALDIDGEDFAGGPVVAEVVGEGLEDADLTFWGCVGGGRLEEKGEGCEEERHRLSFRWVSGWLSG